MTGHNKSCLNCISDVEPGVFVIRRLIRNFVYSYEVAAKSKYAQVQRKQFSLMLVRLVPFYLMQGTTTDPGMVAYLVFPQSCSTTIKWLFAYVMLSRPRCLATLQSVRFANEIRSIIDAGPPDYSVANFRRLFDVNGIHQGPGNPCREVLWLAASTALRTTVLKTRC